MNPIRMQFMREKLLESAREHQDEDSCEASETFAGLDILDIGCGGGLLCESLARLGANTLGIDASSSNVAIATHHASADPSLNLSSHSPAHKSSRTSPGMLSYAHTSAEDLLAAQGPKQFDVVCAMEVIEHVDNPRLFLNDCAQLVKPGGHLFISTIARTPLAYFLTIFAAEQMLRLVSPGTHTYSKYINPNELIDYFHQYKGPEREVPWITRLVNGIPLRTEAETRGMVYLPWKGEWSLIPRHALGAKWAEGCNYLFWVRRPTE
ncbi:uncharacterized protein FIBRA_03886 [Fibroporia radiculosa]|uniref:3-demethylubiquinol 3-O-methyltransferase n=1 Tax=Fibroporia radiculosa TaxID=599839 RepID=J4G6H7_9APHY|nr:uncharacterized protein FIBRA_03886 [Fibroporia radiculosa]CCM01818.1 predicted protein [Fibroporia radiculosa]